MRTNTVLFLLLIATAAFPADAEDHRPISKDATISVDFPDTLRIQIIRDIAWIYKLDLVVPLNVPGTTKLSAKDRNWRELFDLVLLPAGFGWREDNGIVHVFDTVPESRATGFVDYTKYIKEHHSRDEKQNGVPWEKHPIAARDELISIDFPDEPRASLIKLVSEMYDLKIRVPAQIPGRISIRLENKNWRAIFDEVLRPVGFAWREEDGTVEIFDKFSAARDPTNSGSSAKN